MEAIKGTADKLVSLYSNSFGGKEKGRFRISAKLVRQIMMRRRLYEEDVRALTQAMMERGYVLVDMDVFFVIMSTNTFVNYRRANEEVVK